MRLEARLWKVRDAQDLHRAAAAVAGVVGAARHAPQQSAHGPAQAHARVQLVQHQDGRADRLCCWLWRVICQPLFC